MSDSDDGIPDFSKFLSEDDEGPTELATEREHGSDAPTAEIATLPRDQDESTQLQAGPTSSAPPDAPESQPQPPPPSQVKEGGQLESSASIGTLPTFSDEGESVPVNPDRILVREFTAKLCAKICPSEGSTNKSATVKQSKAKRTSLFASTKSFLSRKALRKTSMDETDVLAFQSVREFLRAIHDKSFDVSALLQVRIFLFEDIVVFAVQPEPNNSLYLKAIGWMKSEDLQVRDLEPLTYTFDSFEDQMDSDGEQDGSDAVSDENQAPGREAGITMFEVRDQSSKTKYVVDTSDTNTKRSWIDSLVSLGQMAYRKVKPSTACDKLGWQHTIYRGTLWAAVLEYDIYQIERFLELDSPALHRADGQGLTALHYAAWYGRSLVVKRLLQHGADVTSLDDELRSPLHCAAQQLHADASRDLVHAKADVNGRDMKERTPLLSCVTHLCTNNLSHSLADTTLSRSHLSDGIELIKLLVSNGADINATNLDGQSSMFLALKNSQVTVMEHLILAGGNIEVTDGLSGQTPLQFVCSNPTLQKRPELLRKLLELGANPNAKSSQNDNTPLDTLFGSENENEKTAMVQELLSHGARIDLAGKAVQAQASQAPYQRACDVWSALTKPPDTHRIAQVSPGQLPIACDAKSAKWEQDSSVSLCRGCTLPFGLMQRKHHCRGCGKVYCSKCSSKTFLMRKFGSIDDVLPAQERVCTMCFNMFCQSIIRAGGNLAVTAASKSRLVSSDRKELFENRDQVPSQVQGGTGIGAATSALEKTQERLVERGEKLERLADKSAAMNASAASFSNAARRLREREEKNSSWFGGLF